MLYICHAADGHIQTSRQAPVPLGGAVASGSLTWGRPLPDASSKVYKMVLKSYHGWQLDGQVTQLLTAHKHTIQRLVQVNDERDAKASRRMCISPFCISA